MVTDACATTNCFVQIYLTEDGQWFHQYSKSPFCFSSSLDDPESYYAKAIPMNHRMVNGQWERHEVVHSTDTAKIDEREPKVKKIQISEDLALTVLNSDTVQLWRKVTGPAGEDDDLIDISIDEVEDLVKVLTDLVVIKKAFDTE